MICWILFGVLIILAIGLIKGKIQGKKFTQEDDKKIQKILRGYRD